MIPKILDSFILHISQEFELFSTCLSVIMLSFFTSVVNMDLLKKKKKKVEKEEKKKKEKKGKKKKV